jgi:O-antigen/teichoic acid export membrane protein
MTQPDDDREERQDVAHAARSGGMQVLTVVAQALISVTHVLLARLYGRAVFGSYQASLAILELVTRGGTGGAGGGMLRFVAGHRARGETEEMLSAIGSGLRFCLLLSGVAVVLLIAGAGPVAHLMREPQLAPALRIIAPAATMGGCVVILLQASLAAKVTRANFYVRGLGEPAFLLLAGVSAALFGRSLATLATAHLIAATATLVLAVVAVGRVFGRGRLARALRGPWLPGFVRFSLPMGLSDLMNAVLQRTDIILLTAFLGTKAAAVYAAAEFVTRVISSARSVFDSVAAPVFSEAVHLGQPERLERNLVMMNRWVVSVAMPIAFTVVVLRRELLELYGPTFIEGATAMCVLAASHLVNVSLGLVGWILVTGGSSRVLFLNNIAGAAVNVVLGVVLIPRFGLVGTASAALGSVVLVNLLMMIEVRIGFRVWPFDRTILKPLVAAAATLAAEVALGSKIASVGLRVPLVIVTGLVIYLGSLLALGLAPEERHLLAGVRARFVRRRPGPP